MSPRGPVKPREPGSLKDAAAQLVMACGGQRAASMLTRVSPTRMGQYTDDSDEHADSYMPIDVVLALEERCGQPIVTRCLARLQRRALLNLELPELDERPSEVLATLCEDTGELLADTARAIEHDRFNPKKARKARDEAVRTMGALIALTDALPKDWRQG